MIIRVNKYYDDPVWFVRWYLNDTNDGDECY